MTGEEAYILRNAAWLGTNKDREKIEKALNIAICSLEAWEKVIDEISQNGNSDINTQTVLEIIKKHLGEVKV